jgi:hypothetical protein
LIAGLYGSGAKHRHPIIPGVEDLLQPYGNKAVAALVKAIEQRNPSGNEMPEWKKALSKTVDENSASMIISRLEKHSWLLEPLLESGVNLKSSDVARMIEKSVVDSDGKLSSGRCYQIATKLDRSVLRADPWVLQTVSLWVRTCYRQHGSSNNYESYIPELSRIAVKLGAIQDDDIRKLAADLLHPNVRAKVYGVLSPSQRPAIE